MGKGKTRVVFDTWIARLGSVFGWICLVFWALMAAAGFARLGEARDGMDRALPFICLGLAAVHYLLIRAMRKTKELVEDFRLYSSVLAQDPDKEIAGITETLKIPQEQVMRRLQEMCRRGYFDGHINFRTQRMELNAAKGVSVERCPGCGAATAVSRTGDVCRYCGAPLTRNQ